MTMASNLNALSVPISPSPAQDVSFTAVVAKFSDADHNTNPALYSAMISWGDGQSSAGNVVSDPAGGFDVVGTHSFTQSGPLRLTAQISDNDGDSVSISTTNIVAQAPITATGTTISAIRGVPIIQRAVATFTDPNPNLNTSSFSATINWGDGRTSTGKVIVDSAIGGFEVVGSHVYRTSGSFSVQTTIQQRGPHQVASFYTVSNIISDGAVTADHVDSDFVNPWGLVAPNPADFWSGNNGTGTSTVFDSAGNISIPLHTVTIPPPTGQSGPSTPTGIVLNTTSGFAISNGTTSGVPPFIWATEDGTIAGWSPRVSSSGTSPSTQAFLGADNSASGAIYKGLTLVTLAAGNSLKLPAGPYLFATNFHAGTIDVFNSSYQPMTLPAGTFQDRSIPRGFAPFGIQTIGNNVYVTYAKQDSDKEDDVAGPGNGFVDVYSASSGALVQRLGGHGKQRELNSPWAVMLAPANFGAFSNDILVGNFGDSHISAFDPATGAFLGQLNDARGKPLVLDGGVMGSNTKGLWGVFAFANGVNSNTVYFNTGFNDENDGLFGSLTATTVATATATSTASVISHGGHH
jgi:uncharacterized protein (TIGR03118 family)